MSTSINTSPAVIEPQRFIQELQRAQKLSITQVPENIIVFLSPGQVPYTSSQKFESKKILSARLDFLNGVNLAILSQVGLGAPALALYLEMLIALGARSVIALGSAGALTEALKIGDVVLCQQALRREGVSQHYSPFEEWARPDQGLYAKIKSELQTQKVGFHEGMSWTTDAFFRETREDVDKYRARGILTVEMEAAAFYAVAQNRKISAASLFVISDVLGGVEWRPHFRSFNEVWAELLLVATAGLTR